MSQIGLHERLTRHTANEVSQSYLAMQRSFARYLAKVSLKFASLLAVSLFAGGLFGATWGLGFNEAATDAYCIGELKHMIHGFDKMMPLMGAICLATTIGSALVSGSRRTLHLQIGAVVCLVVAGVISTFLCSPIDHQILTWSTNAPPGDWMASRDEWWQWHVMRMVFAIGALALLILALLTRRGATPSSACSAI